MKKYLAILATCLLSVGILTACNSDDKADDTKKDPETTQTDQNTTGGDTDKDSSQPAETSGDLPATKDITFMLDGKEQTETATLTDSDNQNFSIYKLDGFELTGEEPNKDTLYYKDFDKLFMRIETISTNEASFSIVDNLLKETIQAVSVHEPMKELLNPEELPQGEGITNQHGYRMSAPLGDVTGYIYQQGNLIVKITVFDREGYNLTDEFLRQGQTVVPKK